MKMIKATPIFILVFTGYLCNALDDSTPPNYTEIPDVLSPSTDGLSPSTDGLSPSKPILNSPRSSAPETQDGGPGSSLPTRVVAGVSIALVLLFTLIVAVFWYAWKKSQEGSIEINPIPYGEAGVSLRSLPVPEN